MVGVTGSVAAVLAEVGRFGPFFTVSTDPAEEVDPTWRPLRSLPEAVDARIAHVERVLSEQAGSPVEHRVAASIAVQGFAARLVSAPIAAVALTGTLPALSPDSLFWRISVTGPWPLWTDTDGFRDPGELPALVAEEMAEPLVAAAAGRVSAKLLWGNVASSVAGAKRVLADPRATAVVEQVLAHPLLAAAGERRPPVGPDLDWTFRRRSCCLYYRLPAGGKCSDCALT
ncbi:(2Fe-2S)-binding protein [Pseudonocardia sp. WMMC193]|uniref:(2Fe-2S)-binding protein n=1 Tax=Pseudonocardia sp. WMMC193 TaxID=2911965 RepID=UPI001EFFDED9|nr:(2Fe-2S)-binding protein [Pseudonocardia sp. WMMC193]MCF7547680.1 (2Fe-2S)-binding protein [Pseudonocardia sp. WMMC193]